MMTRRERCGRRGPPDRTESTRARKWLRIQVSCSCRPVWSRMTSCGQRAKRVPRAAARSASTVLIGSVDDDTLTEFYASRLVIPRIAPEDLARIPAAVLKRIPADMAAEFRVVPVAADGELNLTLAMSDPADQ